MANDLYDFVLDCSVTMAWCFKDESNDFTDKILESLGSATAIVPTIWSLEVANVLMMANKSRRIGELQSASFIDALLLLPIVVDDSTTSRAMHSIYIVAGQSDLSVYDAAYLELAIREKIPLLTLDRAMIKAAKKWNVSVTLD